MDQNWLKMEHFKLNYRHFRVNSRWICRGRPSKITQITTNEPRFEARFLHPFHNLGDHSTTQLLQRRPVILVVLFGLCTSSQLFGTWTPTTEGRSTRCTECLQLIGLKVVVLNGGGHLANMLSLWTCATHPPTTQVLGRNPQTPLIFGKQSIPDLYRSLQGSWGDLIMPAAGWYVVCGVGLWATCYACSRLVSVSRAEVYQIIGCLFVKTPRSHVDFLYTAFGWYTCGGQYTPWAPAGGYKGAYWLSDNLGIA